MKRVFKYSKAVLVIIITAASISCNSDETIVEDTNDTFLDYQLLFDSNQNQTTVTARFTEGNIHGNEIILTEEESITFMTAPLQYDEEQNQYVRSYEGSVDKGDFVYTSSNGKTYINPISDYEAIAFPATFTTFSRSEGFTLDWVGTSLELGEHVEVGIGDPNQGSWAGDVFDGEGRSNFQFQAQDLLGLHTGTWLAQITRTKLLFYNNAKTTKAGSRVVHKYRMTVQVEVTD